jgi:hypothetical protein
LKELNQYRLEGVAMSKKMKVRVLKKRCKFCKRARKDVYEAELDAESSFGESTPDAIRESKIYATFGYNFYDDGNSYTINVTSYNDKYDIPDKESDPCMFSIDIPIRYCPICGRRLRGGRLPDEYREDTRFAGAKETKWDI